MAKKIHYGWIICVCGVFILFCTNGMTANAFYAALPFIEETGYTGAQGSMLVSLRCLTSFLIMLVVNPLYRKIGLRSGLTLGCGIIALGYYIMSIADSYIVYLIAAAMLGIGYGIGAMIPVSFLISKWFNGYRATALSICSVGTGLCSMIVPPVFTNIVENVSLPWAFRFLSGLAFGIMLLTFLVVRNIPADKGLLPVEGESTGKKNQNKVRIDIPVWARRLITAAVVLLGGLSIASAAHFSVHFISSGHGKMLVANLLSLFGLTLIISKFFYGVVVDKIGGKLTSGIFLSLMTAGCLLCCFARYSVAYVFAGLTLMGIGYPVSNVGVSIWAEDFSTEAYYSKLLRNLQMAYSVGGMIMSSFPGKVYDRMGSYTGAYIVFTAMLVIVTLVLLYTYRLRQIQIEQQ